MSLSQWWQSATQSPFSTESLIIIALVLLVAVRAAVRRSRLGRRLDAALTLLVFALLALALGTAAAAEGAEGVVLYARAVFVAGLAIAMVRVLLILLVDVYLRERRKLKVSAIVRDIVGMGAYFVIVLMVLRAMLDINLASLIATSAVLTAIIGLAFQDVLGSIISGLVIEAEEPFTPNEWVRVGAYEGQVVETGWRTTRICTRQNEVIVLPNTYLAREPLVNYARPDPRHCDIVRFQAAYEIPPNMVKAAVLGVLRDDTAVLTAPVPEVYTDQFGANGVDYVVRYWLDDFAELHRIRDRLHTKLWYALRRGGVRIPFPTTELIVHPDLVSPLEQGDLAAALARVPLLGPLAPEEVGVLAKHVHRLAFAEGETIVREGDTGDSFYFVERGVVSVTIGGRDGSAAQMLSRMVPGDYFGEMSLLTGEPRSANVTAESDVVVLEIGRSAFENILSANPALLDPISQIAAHRQEAQLVTRRARPVIPPFAQDAAAQRLRQRIKAFLGL